VYTRSHDGYWTFLGRNNDMIKAGGIWVSPAEVEAVLIEHPDVLEAAVVGGRDSDGLETTVAFVVPRAGHAIDPAGIDAHCRARMAAFKRPRRLVVTDALPRTATGKVQRFRLRERLDGP
jgi:acyl-coenzyme A synthetase/AMP-(fatty) acid ligase